MPVEIVDIFGELLLINVHKRNAPPQWVIRDINGKVTPLPLDYKPPTTDDDGNNVAPGAAVSIVSCAF